ncbi:MAG: hypothetical protein ACXABY_12285 [Candidatus Thorarchaeota archaeon]|jgi:hypothetical protein
MREETKKPLWNLIQEMVMACFTGYRSLLMLLAIMGKKEGYESALDHFTWYMLNSSQLPKDTDLKAQEIRDMFETCVHEHMKQVTYAAVDVQHMLSKYGLDIPCPEKDRVGYYLNAMEEQCSCLDWALQPFILSSEQLKRGEIVEVGCAHFGFLKLMHSANTGLITACVCVDKRPIDPKRIARAKTNFFKGLLDTVQVDLEEQPQFLHEVNSPIIFTNMLHCLQEPMLFLENLLLQEHTPIVLVVEPTPNSSISYAFNYHMRAHGGGGAMFPGAFELLARKVRYNLLTEYPNKQFTVYRFTRK